MASSAPPLRPSPRKSAGRLWVLAAAVLWSSSGLFVKSPLFTDWSAAAHRPWACGLLLAFWRATFAAIVLLPMIRRPRWRAELVPLTFCFTAMNVLYLTSMTLTTAANAIWLQMTAPWWVFLFGVLLFREPIVRRDLVPLCFGVLGVATILAFEIRGKAPGGVLLGLSSGVAYAGVVLFMRRVSAEDSAFLVALNHAVAAIVLMPVAVYLGIDAGLWPSRGQLLALAGFGTLQMAIPYTFLARGLRAVSSQEAVAIGLMEPVLLPIWVWLVWREMPAWWTAVGASLILAGLVLRYGLLEKRRAAADLD